MPYLVGFLTFVGALVLVTLLFLAFARLLRPDSNIVFIWLNAYTFWIYVPAYGVALLAAGLRRWLLLVPALVVCALHLWWVVPDYSGAKPIPAEAHRSPQLRLVSANVFHNNEELDDYVPLLVSLEPDVLFLQEYGRELAAALESAGLRDELPYRREAYSSGWAFGIAVYSRFPLEDIQVQYITRRPVIRADITVDGRPLRLFNIHAISPGSRWVVNPWNQGWREFIALFETQTVPFLVAGDFNMTQHHRWYRELQNIGMKSCHDERGRGNATTWPYGGGRLLYLLFPHIRIDQVFVSDGVACMAIAEGDSPGSDHRPVIADIAILP